MQQSKYRKICLVAIVGIVLLISHCNSHQMSISNTWTLPQDGFTVFYRFFRDKISWYEADAVCQFHHSNLVTVDNGVKYDASRAFLSDLNVTENVWIGLMRSQNSDRFMWSNSKILDREFGYWAEQIPTTDSPMCAVVDPMKDYRWHSLRCGGPDVAAFLCEMEAPEWATECLIRALPSLSIQYLADSATIELSRDCGAEGMKRLTCNGKQDQDMIQRELMCLSERETFTSDNRMKAIIDEPQLQNDDEISAQSDNTENNSIDKVANQIEASVDKVGDKLDLDDILLGDAPAAITSQEAIDDDEIKPIKTVKKIAMEKPSKNNPKQMRKLKTMEHKIEDLMMGDQAAAAVVPGVEVVTEEILPHVKKMIEVSTTPRSVLENGRSTTTMAAAATRSRRETDIPAKTNVSAPTTESNTIVKSESEIVQSKILYKDTSFNYFIPPMLLVQHQNSTAMPPLIAAGAAADIGAQKQTNQPSSSTIESIHDGTQLTTTTTSSSSSSSLSSTQVPTTINPSIETSSNVLTTIDSVSNVTQETSPSSATTETTTVATTIAPSSTQTHLQNLPDFPKTNLMRPHAPKFGGEISYHAPAITLTTEKVPIDATATVNDSNSTPETGNTTAIVSTAENATQANSNEANSSISSTTVKSTELTTEAAKLANEPTTVTDVPREVAKRSNIAINTDKHQHKEKQQQQQHEQHQQQQHKSSSHQQTDEANKKHADFTNSNLDYERYKPNRKRILTKPETHTYIQKIFG